jgi:hypothetical protein
VIVAPLGAGISVSGGIWEIAFCHAVRVGAPLTQQKGAPVSRFSVLKAMNVVFDLSRGSSGLGSRRA